eukprot:Opistho-2@35924
MFEAISQWAYGESYNALDLQSPQRQAAARHDIIIDEAMMRIRIAEDAAYERDKEQKRKVTKVDYSWLFPEERKRYNMPASVSMRLSELALRLTGEECTACLSRFRDLTETVDDVERIADIMLCVIEKTLADRPAETGWRASGIIRRASISNMMSSEWAEYVRSNIGSIKDAAAAPIGKVTGPIRRLSASLSTSSFSSFSLPSTAPDVRDNEPMYSALI